MKRFSKYFALSSLALLLCASCRKKADPYADEKGHYFSIKEFELDQWNNFTGAPFTIMKTTRVNDGKTDSALTNSDTLNWAPIFKVFAETDISDHKYLGKYKFSQFDDTQDGTHNFYYEATDEDMFTQKLLITIDLFNSKVKGIYIQTVKHDFTGEHDQKLYYAPVQTIQIQQEDRPLAGSKKFTVVQYDFMR